MTEVSNSTAANDDLLITSFEEVEKTEENKHVQEPALSLDDKADPKDSLERMQAETALKQAEQANLERLHKIEILEKELTPLEETLEIEGYKPPEVVRAYFTKTLELIKLLMTSYKETTSDVTPFEQKARALLKAGSLDTSSLSPLEANIFDLYLELIGWGVIHNKQEITGGSIHQTYYPFYLYLEALKDDTGICLLDSHTFLKLEREALIGSMNYMFRYNRARKWIVSRFFNDVVKVNYIYILGKEKSLGISEERGAVLANEIVSLFFNTKLKAYWKAGTNGHILKNFMPFIIQYGNAKDIESLLCRLPKNANKLGSDNFMHTIKILLQVIREEIDLKAKNSEKRLRFLFETLKSMTDKTLTPPLPFSINRDLIEKAHEQTYALIEKAEKSLLAQ